MVVICSLSLGVLSVGYSITDDVLHLSQNSSGLFVGQATDLFHTITGQTPDSYKWILLRPLQIGISSSPCFPLSFVAIFCRFLYRSCKFLLLLPTTVVSLNSAIVRFILHTTDEYLFFSPCD